MRKREREREIEKEKERQRDKEKKSVRERKKELYLSFMQDLRGWEPFDCITFLHLTKVGLKFRFFPQQFSK